MFHARKGTAALFRADRRWAALSPGLTIEVFLNINQEIRAAPEIFTLSLSALSTPFQIERIIKSQQLNINTSGDLLYLVSEIYSATFLFDPHFFPELLNVFHSYLLQELGVGASPQFLITTWFLSGPQTSLINLFNPEIILKHLLFFTEHQTQSGTAFSFLSPHPRSVPSSFGTAWIALSPLYGLPSENIFDLYLAARPSLFSFKKSIHELSLSSRVSFCTAIRILSSRSILFPSGVSYLHSGIHCGYLFLVGESVSSRLVSLIEEFLLECSISPEFKSISEFTTQILNLLISSIPLPKPIIPYGGIFFTDIARIYKYLIDFQS